MPRRSKMSTAKAKAEASAASAAPAALDNDRIVQRADGFYWESKSGGEPHGPFPTLAEAEADMLAGGATEGDGVEQGESLQEAESELGIAEWIDPDTGGPAEDNVPRIEDH